MGKGEEMKKMMSEKVQLVGDRENDFTIVFSEGYT